MIKHHKHKAQIAQSKCECLITVCTKPCPFLPFEPQFISPPHKFPYLFFLMEERQSMCLYWERLKFSLWGFTFLRFRLKTTEAHFNPPPTPHGGVEGETMNKRLRHLVHCEHLFISTILLQLVTEPAVPKSHTAKLNSQFVDTRYQSSP